MRTASGKNQPNFRFRFPAKPVVSLDKSIEILDSRSQLTNKQYVRLLQTVFLTHLLDALCGLRLKSCPPPVIHRGNSFLGNLKQFLYQFADGARDTNHYARL